ncbi:MAG TPA: ankyrin repeat domain-containing protein [Bacteroidales bacterium]|nr:ankyrin repeat domain-containing protein [Bacteroidales bacterium]
MKRIREKAGIFILLMFAVHNIYAQEADTLQLLLRDTSPLDTSYFANDDNEFNLVLAAERGDVRVVNLLLNRGVNPDVQTWEGVTPLMYAAGGGHYYTVELLINRGADVNISPDNGITALIGAAKANYPDIAELLLRNGAEINAGDEYGATALMYAAAYGYYVTTDMLLYYDANPNIQDKRGNTALMSAILSGFSDISKLLLDKEANPDIADHNGFTPLMIAAENNLTDIAGLLIDHNASIVAENDRGYTALAIAVVNQHADMVNLLLQHGADANKRITFVDTPYTLALSTKNELIIDQLKASGGQKIRFPRFEKITAGFSLQGSKDDFIMGIGTGIKDTKFKISIQAGFEFRPTPVRVVVQQDEHTLNQYWERRNLIYLEADKEFLFSKEGKKETGLFAGVKGIYSFGGYRGLTKDAGIRYLLSPKAGFVYQIGMINIKLYYSYLNWNINDLSPNWIGLSARYNISLNRKGKKKQIPVWFDNSGQNEE